MRLAGRRIDPFLLVILLVALGLRLFLATEREYVHDENNTAIPLSQTISFDPANLHLPIRGENHPALPAYVVKAAGALFGPSMLGYRGLHLILGLVTLVIFYAMTQQWYGDVAARWATALMAFNEYYLNVSSRATTHVPNLLLVTGAMYAFSRFLATERVRYLYGTAVSLGLAFYCKESTALLMPVFALTLLLTRHRRWLLSPHLYLACIVYVLVLGPDIAWNLRTNPETATVTYNNQTVGQATYAAHFRRIGGLGFSPYPSMFYLRRAVLPLYPQITGRELRDETEEYWSVNVGLGVLLLAGVLASTIRPRRNQFQTFLLLVFWGIFTFFTLIKRGDPPFRLDPVSWIWVEITLLPAIILTAAWLADLKGRWRMLGWAYAGLVLATAGWQLVHFEYAEDSIVQGPSRPVVSDDHRLASTEVRWQAGRFSS